MAACSRTGLQTPNAFIRRNTVFIQMHTVFVLFACTKCQTKQVFQSILKQYQIIANNLHKNNGMQNSFKNPLCFSFWFTSRQCYCFPFLKKFNLPYKKDYPYIWKSVALWRDIRMKIWFPEKGVQWSSALVEWTNMLSWEAVCVLRLN